MNTRKLFTPSHKLKQHVRDLRQDGKLVVHDVKNQVSADFQEIKAEANAQLKKAQGVASNLHDSLKSFTTEHSLSVFGLGLATGVIFATWRKN